MSKPLWFHKTKSNRIILLGPKQEDAAGGCREREGRPCAREAAAEVSRAQNRPSRSREAAAEVSCAEPAFLLTGSCCRGLSNAEPAFLLTGSCRGRCVRLRHQRLNVRPMAQCLKPGQ